MANDATRTVRVRFDGNARGLIGAAKSGERAVKDFENQAKKSAVAVSASVSGGLIDALGNLPSVLKGAAIVAGAGIGVVMAPALASALISGVLMAVGGGVLAAGIVGAARNKKVARAWQRFGKQAEKAFDRFSEPFIKPVLRAIDTFSRALLRAEPIVRRIGETLAPVIDQLAPAFAAMAENALPGILAAAQASVPLFQILADNLPGIGTAVAGFFQAIAQGAPVAQVFFDRFLGWVQEILPKLGGFVVWLANLGTKMEEFSKGPQFTGLVKALDGFKDHTLDGLKKGLDDIKFAVSSNSETWKTLTKDVERLIGILGPFWSEGVHATLTGIAAMIIAFAKLYEAIRKVVVIIKELFSGSKSLPTVNSQFGSIPGRAKGGSVQPFNDYLVGEEGPEILRMGATGGTVIPNDKLPTGGGAPTFIEIPIYIGEECVRVVRHEISESNRSTRRLVLTGAGAR